jgi:CRP/FNR family cyclic AMP-dependent transcriptional regulator
LEEAAIAGKNIAIFGADPPWTSFMQAMGASDKTKSGKKNIFDAQALLDSAGVARRLAHYQESEIFYSQGDPASSVLCVQEGSVKLSVVNEAGKEAVLGILGPGAFFGERCLGGETVRMRTATALKATTVFVIEKSEMIRVLRAASAFSDSFLSHMLARNIRIEEDLADQLFNSAEKRLARCLLLLAGYGEEAHTQKALPKISQETLAEMIGTTRSRVNLFMNKFKKMGFIKHRGDLHIEPSLLTVVLNE